VSAIQMFFVILIAFFVVIILNRFVMYYFWRGSKKQQDELPVLPDQWISALNRQKAKSLEPEQDSPETGATGVQPGGVSWTVTPQAGGALIPKEDKRFQFGKHRKGDNG
jgi:hypothetical protein